MGHSERRSHFGSDAFSLEYQQNISKESLYKDIESYLGEYRFKIPRYDYKLLYTPDAFGLYNIVDPNDGESMIVKAERALKKRQNALKDTNREKAEYEGLLSLETQLQNACDGATILWTSPPGSAQDGYGDYGFFYVGKVYKDANSNTSKHISMTAIRIDRQTVAQCREAITQLTGQPVDFQNAEACIAQPAIVSPINAVDISRVLQNIFNFTPDFESEQVFIEIMTILKPHVFSFIDLIHRGVSKDIIQKGFYALENYAIKLREVVQKDFNQQVPKSALIFIHQPAVSFQLLVRYFGDTKPPAVAGSCGSTGSRSVLKSSNIFNSFSSLTDLFSSESSENFICPHCGEESTPPVGDQCPKCKFTKEEAKQQGMITC